MQIKEMMTVVEVGALRFKFDYRGGRLTLTSDNISSETVLSMMMGVGSIVGTQPAPEAVQEKPKRPRKEKSEAAPTNEQPEQAASEEHPEEPSNVTPLPTPEERKASEPVIEELDVVQVEDAAKAAAKGDQEVPEKLLNAPKLKEVVLYFSDEKNLKTVPDLIDACKAWREQVPALKAIREEDLERRVQALVSHLGIGAAS